MWMKKRERRRREVVMVKVTAAYYNPLCTRQTTAKHWTYRCDEWALLVVGYFSTRSLVLKIMWTPKGTRTLQRRTIVSTTRPLTTAKPTRITTLLHRECDSRHRSSEPSNWYLSVSARPFLLEVINILIHREETWPNHQRCSVTTATIKSNLSLL